MRNTLYFLAILALMLLGLACCYFAMKALFFLLSGTAIEEVAPALAVIVACAIMWPIAMFSEKLDGSRLKR